MIILAAESSFLGTLIVGIIVAAVVALSIRSMVRDKKQGKSLQCGCKCSECKYGCSGAVGALGSGEKSPQAVKQSRAEKQSNATVDEGKGVNSVAKQCCCGTGKQD